MRRAANPYVMKVLGFFWGCKPGDAFTKVGMVMELMENGSLASLQVRFSSLYLFNYYTNLAMNAHNLCTCIDIKFTTRARHRVGWIGGWSKTLEKTLAIVQMSQITA